MSVKGRGSWSGQLAFVLACAAVVALGVRNGLERSNIVIMPLLLALAIALEAQGD